jgi:hypothetical protein
MKHTLPKFNFLIDLPVRNEWSNVDLLRISILNCFTAIFADMEGCHTFAMIAAELLENAIKYGKWDTQSPLLHLRVWGQEREAAVQVENPVDPQSNAATALLQTIEWLNGFSTPEDAYRERLLEVAKTPRKSGLVSRLGLTRIAYEGNCKLRAEFDGENVRVTSTMHF